MAEPYQPVAPLERQVQVSRNVCVRESRAEVQTAIVTAVATSDRTELIRPPPNFFGLTSWFVNSACRPTGVGVASDVQLSSQRTHRQPQPLTIWHDKKTDCHVGKFDRAPPCLGAFGRLWMYVLDCVCGLAPAPVLVVGGVLECSPACACACVCQSVARSCVHVSLLVSLHVCGCAVWIMCASYELLVCACVRNNKHLRK